MNQMSTSAPAENTMSASNEKLIRSYSLFVSLFTLVCVPIAVSYTKEWNFFDNLWTILTSPSPSTTDYFALGGLGSTLFNVAICGLIGQGIGIGISCVLIWAMNTFVVEYLGVPMELANILNVFMQGSIFCAFLAFAGVVSWISMGRLKKERLTEELSVQE